MAAEKNILIVEDEVITALYLMQKIKENGYAFSRFVTTGEEAVLTTALDPPQLILMDIGLAGKMDGLEAASIIHSSSEIPIVIMTAYSSQLVDEKVKNLNPIAFLKKPFPIRSLIKVIDTILK